MCVKPLRGHSQYGRHAVQIWWLPWLKRPCLQSSALTSFDMQIDMYSFSFLGGGSQTYHRYLLPMLDMVNYGADPNAKISVQDDGESFTAVALRPIK